MDAAEALADLTQISTQIELAVLVDTSGEVLASAGAGSGQAAKIAEAARRLLAAAEEAMGEAEARERLVQLQVALPDGCVFLVQDDERPGGGGHRRGADRRAHLLRPEDVPASRRGRKPDTEAEGACRIARRPRDTDEG